MQLKEKSELNQINEQSEFLAKTYQPYRPIKEPQSVAKVDRTNLQPLKEPQSVAKVDRTNLQPLKEPKSVAKVDRTLQPLKEPKSVAKVDRTLQPLKEPKSVAKVDRTNLQPIQEPKSVAKVDIQPKEKPELNQINEQSKFLAKTYQPNRPIKEPKSVAKVDRTNLQPIKEPKSVAKVDRTNLQPIKERKSVAKVDIQPKEKLDLNQINQKLEVLAKTYRQDLQPIEEPKSVQTTYQPYLQPIKEREYVPTTLLKIIFICFPLGILKILFSTLSVVSIILILSAIAIPDFGRCRPYKAMQSEAKQYVSSMNKGQQAKHAENGAFSNSITALGLGIKTQTPNYNYSAIATKDTAFSYGVSRSNNLRSYVGAVFLVPVSQAAKNVKTTTAILCETNTFDRNIQPPNPILENDVPVCAAGTSELSK